ncbi:hypothetical protein HYALB_00003144 [Hymenoscyphus albidus]|uniref:Heterokaryon incompatibility domain-containing protein n=1 Tax=Hymenoscyphus albidus TaxID=595503 RepID=A0A9N9LHJ8_9HELO|nr:hypothetical protein HYALB_00003144 [Hymenoscyphus albidus]
MLGINESHLPKTISDAVAITRQLAIKYLWVDSLCICQGDAEDWSRESARMTEVYSNAHIVIANNHGNDSSVGCFSTRIPRPMSELNLPGFARNLVAMVLYIQDEMWVDLGEFGGEALTQRGWALQERVLAKRLLHYNTRQMYFECSQGIFSEDDCTTKNRYCSLDASLRQWNELVASYGKRKLTNSSDKFPAIGGLAKLFEKELKAQYIAGLWSTHLISGLAWSRSHQIVSTNKEYLGPSWSWASYGDRAIFSGEGGSDISKVVEWNVEPRSQSNVYGEIASAWLRIRAPILNLIPGISESMFTLHKDDRSRYVFFDSTETESGKRHTWDLEILLLQEKVINAQIDDNYECFALIVSKVGNERKRVGCKFLWD